MQPPVQVIPPVYAVVSLEEAKQQCRIDAEMTDEDSLVEGLVRGATQYLEKILGFAFVIANWRQDFPAFSDCMHLPLRPVVPESVVITYRDEDNAEQTLSTSIYCVIADERGHYIELNDGETWPSTYARNDAVSIFFDAGNEVGDVPEPLKLAVKLLLGAWYQNREQTVIGVSVSQLPVSVAVDALISPYRAMNL
jgi:uncharacterized phiE125 gp8 family phage protein